MHPKLRAFLEANGLRAGATEHEAWEYYRKLQADGIEYQGPERAEQANGGQPDGGQRSGGDGDSVPGDQPLDADAIRRQIEAGIAADRQRCREIEDACAVAGLDTQASRSMIDRGLSVDEARAEIFAELKKRSTPIGAGAGRHIELGTENRDKFRSAVRDGLALRAGLTVDDPADGHREFRGRALHEIARECLELAGVNVRGLTRMEVVGRALAAGSTSDFPLLMSNLVGKTLLAAYNEWPATWRPFTAITDAPDFKDIYALKMSEAPDLKGLNENGEYQTAQFSESGENYRVITKGIKVPLTRQMIINDDLRAFTRIPRLFGTAARRMEGDAVYSLITGNPVMSDNKTLFHADHRNLGTAAALDSDSLAAGRAAMRKQKGMSGAAIDVTPAFLLITVDEEMTAEVLLRSAALPDDNKSAGVYNPWAGKLTPIADPRLTGTAWYLLAHPNQFPAIEAAYLMGEEQPYVEEMLDFNSDALVTKVRHDFGAGIADYVGIYKNPGA